MFNYPTGARKNHLIRAVKDGLNWLSVLNKQIWLAGRVVGILDDGFILQDESGRLEITNYELRITNYKVGDIIEVFIAAMRKPKPRAKGFLRALPGKQKEMVFMAKELKVLAPCLTDFFIRKEDPNYLKMIVDLNLKEKLDQRFNIIRKIREFFWRRDFVEMETPELVRLPGMEPYLDVFKTGFVGLPGQIFDTGKSFQNQKLSLKKSSLIQSEDLYLITSPEYAMKKLLVSGYEKIFQISKSFRNKETDSQLHNPEFTLLEWYRAYAGYQEIMEDAEQLICELVLFVQNYSNKLRKNYDEKQTLKFQEHEIDVTPPWPRLKVKDAFKNYAGIGHKDFENVENFHKVARQKGYKVDTKTCYDDLFFMVFLNEIEPKLGFDKPVILYEYPLSMAALSKPSAKNPRYAERFEVFIAGIELCNAFTELNDPREQKRRLEAERKMRRHLKKEDYPVDQSFIHALQCGMPPAGGIALGVDRLVMLLTDTPDIRDIMAFPHRDL